MELSEFLNELERRVLTHPSLVLGAKKPLSTRPDRLYKTEFARIVGKTLETSSTMAVDYYGFMKLSPSLQSLAASSLAREERLIQALVVHFAKLRPDTIRGLAPDLAPHFLKIKRQLLRARGFKD